MKPFPINDSSHLAIILLAIYFLFNPTQQWQERKITNGYAFAEKTLQATVKIETSYLENNITTSQKGTGVVITSDGLILTNYHNIAQGQRIEVSLYDGSRLLAKVIATEPRTDLALLDINGHRLPYLPLGNSKILQLGESVFAIGNPMNLDFSLTSGIVSALDRRLNVIEHPQRLEQFIQTDVPINAGCSGGPLLNAYGELVGINTAIMSKSGRFEGYSFAVPVKLAKEFVAVSNKNFKD